MKPLKDTAGRPVHDWTEADIAALRAAGFTYSPAQNDWSGEGFRIGGSSSAPVVVTGLIAFPKVLGQGWPIERALQAAQQTLLREIESTGRLLGNVALATGTLKGVSNGHPTE